MKVKAYRQVVVYEVVEIPDEVFKIVQDVSPDDMYISQYRIKEEYINDYIDEEKYVAIETIDGKTIAEW